MTLLQLNLAVSGYIVFTDTSRVVFDTVRIPNPRGYCCYRHLYSANPKRTAYFLELIAGHIMSNSLLLGRDTKISIHVSTVLLAAKRFISGRSTVCPHYTDLSEGIGLSSILIFGVISITFMTLGYFYTVFSV